MEELKSGQEGKLHGFWVEEIPSAVPVNISPSGGNSICGVRFALASEWENPIDEAAKPVP